MIDSTDMSTPVTRGELQDTLGLFQQELRTEHQHELQAAIAPLATKADLAPLATKADLTPLATKADLAPLATKAELQAAIAPLATRAELQAAIAPLATRAELEMWGGALMERLQLGLQQSEQRLMQELSRHTSAILESMQTQIKASFEPLADLPERVRRLEEAVESRPPARPTRRRKN